MDTYPAMSSWRWKVGTRLKMFRSFSTDTTICSRRTTALSQVIWGNMDACYSSLFICIKYGLPFSLILQSDKHIGPCRSLLLKPVHLYQVWSTFSLILQSDKHIGCHQCLLLKPSLSHQVRSTFSLILQSDKHIGYRWCLLLKPGLSYEVRSMFSLILQSDKHIGHCRSLLLKPVHLYQTRSTVQSHFTIWQAHRMSMVLATQAQSFASSTVYIQSHLTIWHSQDVADPCYSSGGLYHSVSYDNLRRT